MPVFICCPEILTRGARARSPFSTGTTKYLYGQQWSPEGTAWQGNIPEHSETVREEIVLTVESPYLPKAALTSQGRVGSKLTASVRRVLIKQTET